MEPLQSLKWIGMHGGMLPSEYAIVSVDSHDLQREGHAHLLTYKTPQQYAMASAFLLAFPYGTPLVISSFEFSHFDQGKLHTQPQAKLQAFPWGFDFN